MCVPRLALFDPIQVAAAYGIEQCFDQIEDLLPEVDVVVLEAGSSFMSWLSLWWLSRLSFLSLLCVLYVGVFFVRHSMGV